MNTFEHDSYHAGSVLYTWSAKLDQIETSKRYLSDKLDRPMIWIDLWGERWARSGWLKNHALS